MIPTPRSSSVSGLGVVSHFQLTALDVDVEAVRGGHLRRGGTDMARRPCAGNAAVERIIQAVHEVVEF